MSVPVAKGLDLLVFPVVALIDASHPGARAADVVEHRFGHLESYAQPLEIRRQGSSQIVQAPQRQRFAFALVDYAVQLYLALVITGTARAARCRKYTALARPFLAAGQSVPRQHPCPSFRVDRRSVGWVQ